MGSPIAGGMRMKPIVTGWRFGRSVALALALGFAGAASPVQAKVAEVSDRGFVVRHIAQVPASSEDVWAVLVKPAEWWDSAHTWSASAANLSIDARAGGCFCEILPNTASPKAAPRGSVEHMRVIYVERPRALRMSGALGPLQADAVNGTLTVELKPGASGKGTQILLEYVVGGYARTPFEKLAPAVDGVLGEQVRRLSEKLGGAFASAFPLPDADALPPSPSDASIEPLAPAPPATEGSTIIGR